jgi:hypothetical protein
MAAGEVEQAELRIRLDASGCGNCHRQSFSRVPLWWFRVIPPSANGRSLANLEIGRIGQSALNSDALAKPQESRQSTRAVSSSEVTDPFSDSLLYLAAHHGRALSREALLAGLPISDNRLSVALFSRAAQRAGLEVEPVKRKLSKISSLVLPVVLIMRDGSTRIMIASDTEPKKRKSSIPRSNPVRRSARLAPMQQIIWATPSWSDRRHKPMPA